MFLPEGFAGDPANLQRGGNFYERLIEDRTGTCSGERLHKQRRIGEDGTITPEVKLQPFILSRTDCRNR